MAKMIWRERAERNIALYLARRRYGKVGRKLEAMVAQEGVPDLPDPDTVIPRLKAGDACEEIDRFTDQGFYPTGHGLAPHLFTVGSARVLPIIRLYDPRTGGHLEVVWEGGGRVSILDYRNGQPQFVVKQATIENLEDLNSSPPFFFDLDTHPEDVAAEATVKFELCQTALAEENEATPPRHPERFVSDEKMLTVVHAEEEMFRQEGRKPTSAALARKTGFPEATVRRLRKQAPRRFEIATRVLSGVEEIRALQEDQARDDRATTRAGVREFNENRAGARGWHNRARGEVSED